MDLDFDVTIEATEFLLNGQEIDISGDDSVFDVASAINTANVGIVATAQSDGKLKLHDSGGGNIKVESNMAATFIQSFQMAIMIPQ